MYSSVCSFLWRVQSCWWFYFSSSSRFWFLCTLEMKCNCFLSLPAIHTRQSFSSEYKWTNSSINHSCFEWSMSERWQRRPSLFVHQYQRCPFALGCEFVYLQREDIFRSRWRMKWARRNNALTDALEKGLCLLFRFRVLSSSSITLEGRKSIASMCAQVISFTLTQWDERDSNFLESVNREGLRLLLIKAHRAGQQRQCYSC